MEITDFIYTNLCVQNNNQASYRRAVSAFFFIVFEEWMKRQGRNPPDGFKERDFMKDMMNKTRLLNQPAFRRYFKVIYIYRTLADHFYDYGNGYENVSLKYSDLEYQDSESESRSANYGPIDAKVCKDSYDSARNLLKVV